MLTGTTSLSGRSSDESVGEYAEDGMDFAGTPEAPVTGSESLADRPKRPLSAYNMFFRDQRKILLKSLPLNRRKEDIRRGHGKISFQDLAKVIGAKWRDVDPEEKSRYEKIAEEGRNKYRERMKEWKVKQKMNGLPVVKPKKKLKKKVSSTSLSYEANGPCNSGMIPRVDMNPLPIDTGSNGSDGILRLPHMNKNFPGNMRCLDARTVSSYSMGNDLQQDLHSEVSPYQYNWNGYGYEEEHSFPRSQQQPTTSTDPMYGRFCHSDYTVESDNVVPSYHMNNNSSYSREFAFPIDTFEEDIIAEPTPLDHQPIPTHEQSGSTMNNLADRMGPECVDLFLGIFGNPRRGNYQ